MPTNRKSYNGAYEVPTKGKPEQEMTNGSGGGNGKPSKPSGGTHKPSTKY